MKRNLLTLAVPVAIAASFLNGCSTPLSITDRTDPNRSSIVQVGEGFDTFGRKWEVLSRNESMLLSYTGTITDIDYANREMTLESSEGRLQTFSVDKKMKRFDEVRVGDKVSLDYYLGFNAEVRTPTPEEQQNPLVVLESAGRSGPDAAPAGYDARRIRAVVTIEAMDKPAQTVTVKSPRGKYYTARVADPSRMDKVGIGDSVVMTFTTATAISLKHEMLSRHEFVRLNYTGTITDIDYADREMTLKGPTGLIESFYVDKKVERFNEFKVGDKVSLDYYLGFNAEVRKPTPEEEQNPLVVQDSAGRAGPDAPPAAQGMRQIRAVATIAAINKSAQTVTVKGPRGKYYTARVADPSRLNKVRIGDTILMTFTESTAVSLKQAEK